MTRAAEKSADEKARDLAKGMFGGAAPRPETKRDRDARRRAEQRKA